MADAGSPPGRDSDTSSRLGGLGAALRRDCTGGTDSASHLRGRLAKHHRGAIGSSTLRLSLAAFLWKREGWRPTYASRAQLSAPELHALQDWQRRHLSVQWVEVPRPWDIEPAVIALMRPPLNRSHNETHPEYDRVGRARDSIRDAKTRRVPFQKRA